MGLAHLLRNGKRSSRVETHADHEPGILADIKSEIRWLSGKARWTDEAKGGAKGGANSGAKEAAEPVAAGTGGGGTKVNACDSPCGTPLSCRPSRSSRSAFLVPGPRVPESSGASVPSIKKRTQLYFLTGSL